MATGRTSVSMPQSEDPPRGLLTVPEVARWLRCSRQAVYSWAELGYLPHIKLGRLVRFAHEDVQAFVQAGRRAAGVP